MHLEGCLGVVCSGRIGEGGRLEEVEEWRSLLFGTALGGAKVGACDGAGQEMDCDASGRSRGLIQLEIESAL
jgi:hypothetical protein